MKLKGKSKVSRCTAHVWAYIFVFKSKLCCFLSTSKTNISA